MARRSLLFLPVVMAAVVVASASASTSAHDPLNEQIQLTKADNALASRISLQASDLTAGWQQRTTGLTAGSGSGGDNSCPGFRPDLSSITITGRQGRSFRLAKQGLGVDSWVEVYATREQSQADWRLSVTNAAMKCVGSMIAKDPSTRLVSAHLRPGPKLGEASATFAFVLSAKTASGLVPIHVDMIVVRQERAIALLVTTSAFRSATGQQLVLARMVSRMEKPAA